MKSLDTEDRLVIQRVRPPRRVQEGQERVCRVRRFGGGLQRKGGVDGEQMVALSESRKAGRSGGEESPSSAGQGGP